MGGSKEGTLYTERSSAAIGQEGRRRAAEGLVKKDNNANNEVAPLLDCFLKRVYIK